MNFEKIYSYLVNQKRRLLEMDGAEPESGTGFLTEKEQLGQHFVARRSELSENDDRQRMFVGRNTQQIGLMEILYDNSINWLMNAGRKQLALEFTQLSMPGVISEDTTTSNIATFTTALLPAVRRIFAQLVAMDLVSVQPLAGPTGFIYWIDHEFVSAHAADGITADERIDQEQDSETYTDSSEQGTIRELQFRLRSKQITTESKKVAGHWTLEAEQDVKSQWNLDLEGELIPALGNLIVREINRKIVTALVAGAGAGDTEWNKNTSETLTTEKNAYYATLWNAICSTDTLIFGNKYRNADFLLLNHNTYYFIQRLNQFRGENRIVNQQSTVSTRYVGTLGDMYKVYIDPFMSDDLIVLGVKGPSWRDSIAYYSPYIPLFLSDKYIYSNDFSQLKIGAMQRYAYGVLPETSTQSPVKNGGIGTVTLTSS
ncbi:hypothetical protein ACFLT2_01370 [Acidobacteriota bacterium]